MIPSCQLFNVCRMHDHRHCILSKTFQPTSTFKLIIYFCVYIFFNDQHNLSRHLHYYMTRLARTNLVSKTLLPTICHKRKFKKDAFCGLFKKCLFLPLDQLFQTNRPEVYETFEAGRTQAWKPCTNAKYMTQNTKNTRKTGSVEHQTERMTISHTNLF